MKAILVFSLLIGLAHASDEQQPTVFDESLLQWQQKTQQQNQQGQQKNPYKNGFGGLFGGMGMGTGAAREKINPEDHKKISITISGTDKKVNCDYDSEAKTYLCPNDGKPLLVKNSPFGFTALGRDKKDAPTLMAISKVESGDKILLETPPMLAGFGGGMGGGYPGVNPALYQPVEDLNTTLNNTVSSIDSFFRSEDFSNNRLSADVGSEEFKKIARRYFQESDEAKEAQKRIYKEKNYKVELSNGQSVNCERGESRPLTEEELEYTRKVNADIKCGSFKCDPVTVDGKTYEATMLYESSPGSMLNGSLHLIDSSGIGPEVSVKKILSKNANIPLVDNSFLVDNAQRIKNAYVRRGYGSMSSFLPESLGDDREKIAKYKNPGLEQFMQYYQNVCLPNEGLTNLLEAKKKVLKKLGDLELAEFIQVVGNGNLTGMFVDPAKAPELGCLYQGVYLNEAAAKNLDRIKKNIHPDRNVEQTITMDKASELFKKAQAMDDISWKYKPDGCYARAHLMARRFEAEGVRVDKVWIKGDLYVPGTTPLIQWNFHVAPILYVKDDKGKITKMVIDPSLFDKPVTVEEWDAKMSKNTARGSVITAFPFPENAAMMERSALAFSSSDPYLPHDSIFMSEDEKMRESNNTMKMYKPLEPK